jgi:hypothetical protein
MPIGGVNPCAVSEGCDVRLVAIMIIVFLVGPPALAKPEPQRRECHRLTSQITRYEGDVDLARERGNELWETATLEHIERLSERRASRCPQYVEDKGASLRRLGRMLGTAAKLAARYFTMGN